MFGDEYRSHADLAAELIYKKCSMSDEWSTCDIASREILNDIINCEIDILLEDEE